MPTRDGPRHCGGRIGDGAAVTHATERTAASAPYDGAGYSYSAEALAAAGVRPGGAVASGGTTFIWPDAASGQHDTVTAAGQVIQLSGQGSTLSFLGSGTFGTQGGTITITYTDGSTSSGKITYADWCAGAAASGSTLVTTTAYRNYTGGKQANPLRAYLYAASIPLTAGKDIKSVTMPVNSNLHFFAVTAS